MMENSIGSQEAGVGAVIDDPDQQACADEAATLAATLEGGAASSSWYWTSMLNFSQSGSSSTQTSAGQMAPSHLSAPAASPPSSSSVHIQHVDQHPPSFDNLLASHANTTNNSTLSNDPEQSVWSQEFLSGPIGESKPSIHACSTDDGLQELLYPRTVRELLFSDQLKLDQSPSWDLLQQAAISKSFGFPLGPDDNMPSLAPAQLHSANADIKPGQLLHYSHDDRLSSNTASSTLSDSTQQLAEQWTAPNSAAQPACEHAQPHTCAMHMPHTTLLQQQFDHARVKQEYTTNNNNDNNNNNNTLNAYNNPNNINYVKSHINPFLLQHQQQQHSLRLINPNHDQVSMLNEALLNVDVKPSKLSAWPPNSPATIQHCTRSSSFELGGLPSPAAAPGSDRHHHSQLMNPMKQHNLHDMNARFANPNLPLIAQDPSLFQPDHLLQQAMAQHHHGALLNATPFQYLSHPQIPVGLKKSRAHIEGGQVGAEEAGKERGGTDQKVGNIPHDKHQQLCDDFHFKRPRVDHPQQPPPPPQQPPSTSSFKSQPIRKEKLGERITTLQQLVSPFGKTDTASVLLEAIGYIKFLQDQVQTLSSPYLKSTNNTTLTQSGDKGQNGEEVKPDLRSKGLCLVPLSCTMQVANDNGADYWYGGAFR